MKTENIKKELGFGCMRLPMRDGEVDYEKFCEMTDRFLEAGFTYFDTAHGYIDGKSETAIRECLVKRHPRESFVLADKLSEWHFEKEEDILPLFEKQLEKCGVDYFDYYLFHSMDAKKYEKHKKCNSFNIIRNLKAEGKIRHIAMSFHDTADVLDIILTENPFIEAVQLQINYLDYDDPGVQSKKCYDVAEKHGKKVIVMEPVKGGMLVNLPDEAKDVLTSLGTKSFASYAIRYAASFPNVFMVLSGMGNMDMINDNVATMSEFVPLSEKELDAAPLLRKIIRKSRLVPCTGCEYCMEKCPKEIKIPKFFSAYNLYLSAALTREDAKKEMPTSGGMPSDCIGCGKCEELCPQGIAVRDVLGKIKF